MTPAEQLTHWVKQKYEGRLIKSTYKPYFIHLQFVAEQAGKATNFGYEIGLCHDIFEDFAIKPVELAETLISFGYTDTEAAYITNAVTELTDVFTAAAYPDLGKKERKEQEAARLATISPAAQTVKYCDLIYNIGWVMHYDREHAKKYLKKKQLLVTNMLRGDKILRQKALQLIWNSLGEL
ncbi:hypothetical protein KXD93_14150 [Mucilaginibacter sp. BJC16-A38]|uniref:hypothetical protein n=1 Tax=Mucilaginibacter phenanthrenivorans TaxID=1234842 RepID=UPI0021580606|nr:hypothetical protein [Mucilaginibacter phenanthrenivorans]MCR8558796.1 hypothetical protein [Mucilaginibacter phenanthrenivorans]